jgi:hypothetical protein
MAISEQTLYNTYNPDGVVTTFAYNFCAFDDADIKVYADGVLVSSSDYTVSGVGTRSGGSIVFTTAPLVSVVALLIQLEPSLSRSNDYQQNGELLSDTLDDDIDRMYSVLQYQDLQASRTLSFSDTDATSMVLAGIDTVRANNLLGFDSAGDPTLYVPADLTAVTVITPFAETLLDDADSAEARATLETVKNNRNQEGIRYTTAGTAPNFTVTTASPAVGAYATGQRFTVVFNADGTIGSNTINVNALGAKNVKQYDDAGNKRSGVCKTSQTAIVEYDGTDFVILNPLPVYPLTGVRQTVQGGPITSAGKPDFLPATYTGLGMITTNISTSVPFVVSAAQGFGIGSDRIGQSTSNLTFTCTDATTNYLYVTVNSDGTLTAGTTTVAPVFQQGGSAATTSALGTFDYTRMVMYVGNGATAPAAWRVYVGEAVASGGNITSTVQYAYNGLYQLNNASITLATITEYLCDIGSPCVVAKATLICTSADAGYGVGDTVDLVLYWPSTYYGGSTFIRSGYKRVGIAWSAYLPVVMHGTSNGISAGLTAGKWAANLTVKRIY